MFFLSRYQFVQVFRKFLGELGVMAKEYNSHYFRIGAATEAVRWDLSPDAVKKIGHWESARILIYMRPHLV